MLRQAVKRAVAAAMPPSRAAGIRILLYHAIAPPDSDDRLSLRVAPEAFRAQIAHLREAGYDVVSLRGVLEEGVREHAQSVVITFDDGYASQREAAEFLAEAGLPATFFLVARFLDGEARGTQYWEKWGYLNWEEAKQLVARGFEIGSHSGSHPSDLRQCGSEELRREMADSKSRLEQRLGVQVCSFSYPHGAWNGRVQQAAREAGYQLACSSMAGINREPRTWFALRRTEISGADSLEDFKRKLDGRYDWLRSLHQWRAVHA